MKRDYDVVVAGYLCVDLVPSFKTEKKAIPISEFLKPGRLIELDSLNATLGGVVANTGLMMKRFSKNVFLNSVIGDDFAGKMCIERLKEYDTPCDIKALENTGTAISIVIATPGNDRIFLESPGCSRLFDIRYVNFEAISKSRLFHFGYPPLLRQFYLHEGDQLQELFRRVNEMGVTTSMDFSLPDGESGEINWPDILNRVLPFTDIFAPSLEEALQIMMPSLYAEMRSVSSDNMEFIDLIPIATIRKIGKRIIDSGVKIALIKAGHRGAYLLTGNVSKINDNPGIHLSAEDWNYQELWCRAYPTDLTRVKLTSGAGDVAIAAFLSAVLESKDPKSSLKCATLAGRNNLYYYNSYSEVTDWQDIIEGIRSEPNEIVDLKGLQDVNKINSDIAGFKK